MLGAERRGRALVVAALVGAGGIALAAPQVLTAMSMTLGSARGVAAGSDLPQLLEVVALDWHRWLQVASATPLHALTPYKTAPAMLLLAVLGATRAGLASRYLTALALVSAVLATAGLPLFRALHSFPPFSFFGGPGKLFYLLDFALCSLAALGLDRISSLAARPRRALLALLLLTLVPSLWASPLESVPWLTELATAVAVLAALGAATLSGAPAAAATATLAAIVAAAFLVAVAPLDAQMLSAEGGYWSLLDRPIGAAWRGRPIGRIFALHLEPPVPAGEPLPERAVLGQVPLNFGALWGREAWNGIGPLFQRRQIEVLARMNPAKAVAIVEQLGPSTLVVRPGTALEADLVAAGFTGPPPAGRISALRWLFAPEPPPRFVLAAEARRATYEEAQAAAREGEALAGGRVLIEAVEGKPAPRLGPGDGAGSIAVLAERPGDAHLEVSVARPTWLVAREPYYAAWRATIDGQPAAVHPAAALFLAVEVPPGRHVVHLKYAEPGLRRGLAIALVALLVLPLALRRVVRG